MRAIELRRFDPAVLSASAGKGSSPFALVERSSPEPGHGEVRVDVGAASLNYRDLLVAAGRYNPKQALPLVPCSDGAGRVSAIGPGVESVAVGDRVVVAFAPSWSAGPPDPATLRRTLGSPLDGTLREQIVVPAAGVVPIPADLSDVAAATLPCAGVTAWRALFSLGGLTPGQVVLCLGTGGVSTFALQLAKAAGAHVVVTSRSEEKLERAKALGADETVCTAAEQAFGKAVRARTGGVDLVVEVGGAGTLEQSIKATRPGGTIALIGVLAEGPPPDLLPVLMSQIRVQGVYVGPVSDLAALVRALGPAGIAPVVDKVFPLEAAGDAFGALAAAGHVGKIVVDTRA